MTLANECGRTEKFDKYVAGNKAEPRWYTLTENTLMLQ